MTPAFSPKPTSARTNTAVLVAGVIRSDAIGISSRDPVMAKSKANSPNEAQDREVRRHEVDPARRTGFLLVVLCRYQEECRERHHLPSDQEQETVRRHEEDRHAGREEPVEQADFPPVLRVVRLPPVLEPIDRAKESNQKDRDEKHGRSVRPSAREMFPSGRTTGASSPTPHQWPSRSQFRRDQRGSRQRPTR